MDFSEVFQQFQTMSILSVFIAKFFTREYYFVSSITNTFKLRK